MKCTSHTGEQIIRKLKDLAEGNLGARSAEAGPM